MYISLNVRTILFNNIDRRIAEHNSGCNIYAYTYNRRPVELVYYEKFDNPTLAINREKRIKKWSHKKKPALIDADWDRLVELS